jgi:hypothetical protein
MKTMAGIKMPSSAKIHRECGARTQEKNSPSKLINSKLTKLTRPTGERV